MKIRYFLLCLFFCIQFSHLYPLAIGDRIGIIPSHLARRIPADITFLIADLKYDDNTIKIIEFGAGPSAGYKVLDHTYGKGRIFKKFWNYLGKFHLPIWYVGNKKKHNRVIRSGRHAWNTFKKINGHRINGLHNLVKNKLFKKTIKHARKLTYNSIKHHKAIIILRGRRVIPQRKLKLFKKKYPQLVFINEASYEYVNYKDLTDSLFNSLSLKAFRPKSGIYPRKYTRNLSQKIISDLNCKWYVIKPIYSGRGNGILMVNKEELEPTLKLILQKYNNNLPFDNSFNYRPNIPLIHEYWKYNRQSHFIVEEYVPSKEIMHNGKPYDATIRVIFTLHHDRGNIYFNYIDAYWKRPIKALTDEGTFRERHISKHSPNKKQSQGGKMNRRDRDGMINILKHFMGDVYKNILINYHLQKRSSIFFS